MVLKLSDRGVATAYLSLPLGKFEAEREVVQKAYARWLASAKTPQETDAVSPPEFLYLLGQADMAVQFGVGDFRRLFDVRYPYPGSAALTFNWLYSIPYEFGAEPPRTRPDDSVRFLLHLRLRREMYVYPGNDEAIVRRVADALASAGAVATIHASLGWSDLLVSGWVETAVFEKFISALIEIHGLRLMVDEKPVATFSRMFTLIGYETPSVPLVAHKRHLTLIRGIPGYLQEVTNAVRDLEGTSYVMEGKTDLVIISDQQLGAGFLQQQMDFAEQHKAKRWIQKIETHLVLSPANELPLRDLEPLAVVRTRKHVLRCLCATDHTELQAQIDRHLHLLPDELRQASQNMLLLLSAAMADDSLCCDAKASVLAVDTALLTLLERLSTVTSNGADTAPVVQLKAPDFSRRLRFDNRRKQQQEVYRIYRLLTHWHVFAERVLRQRSVGSFEEMLGQTDRAVTYYGGVQKFLYLADSLINDFVRRIPNVPRKRVPRFATLFDSVKTILSFPAVGTVRIPVRRIFQLPLAVADLWHEVGVSLFFLRYKFEDVPDEIVARAPYFSRLADHYGDLIVYLFGFRGDRQRFLTSLVIGWEEVFRDEPHQEVWAEALFDVVWRAYVVSEFDAVRRGTVHESLEKLVDQIISYVFDFLRIVKTSVSNGRLTMSPEEWAEIRAKAFRADIDQIRDFYAELCALEPPTAELRLLDFANGEVVQFTAEDDLNDHFAALADVIRGEVAPDERTIFMMMAAMGKSATTEYHRRQMSVGGDRTQLRSAVTIR